MNEQNFHREPVDITKFQVASEEAPNLPDAIDYNGKVVNRDDPNCVARQGDSGRCFARICTTGHMTATLFDPQSSDPAQLTQENRNTGRPRFEFRELTPESYASYVAFLRGGNPAYLRQAERGIR